MPIFFNAKYLDSPCVCSTHSFSFACLMVIRSLCTTWITSLILTNATTVPRSRLQVALVLSMCWLQFTHALADSAQHKVRYIACCFYGVKCSSCNSLAPQHAVMNMQRPSESCGNISRAGVAQWSILVLSTGLSVCTPTPMAHHGRTSQRPQNICTFG